MAYTNNDLSVNKRSSDNSIGPYLDFLLLPAIYLLTLVFIFSPLFNHGIARFVLGVILVFVLPGYSFVAAVFPRKNDIGGLERALLIIVFSIVLVPLLGFILNFTIWGVRLEPLLVLITLQVVLCSIIAMARRYRVPADQRYAPDFSVAFKELSAFLLPASKSSKDLLLSVALVFAVLATISVGAYAVFIPSQPEHFTQLYITGPEGKISDYPLSFVLGETKPVILGITNNEGTTKAYDLVVTLASGTQPKPLYSDHFVLGENQTVQKLINITPDQTGDRQDLRFLLYMDSSADPYRNCNLWINVTPNSTLPAGLVATPLGNDTALAGLLATAGAA